MTGEALAVLGLAICAGLCGAGSAIGLYFFVEPFDFAPSGYSIVGRREGDIEQVWAEPRKANQVLGWSADTPILDVLASAWKWEKHLRKIL